MTQTTKTLNLGGDNIDADAVQSIGAALKVNQVRANYVSSSLIFVKRTLVTDTGGPGTRLE